ncbi:transposase [Gracilimonas amylolytica]|uniref:transposase n=1 Tax=Gracilimonas amylolytica TaxID=1749045 RepID=UPI0018E436CF|nr:transposase [Gracilimonas amylolytica]
MVFGKSVILKEGRTNETDMQKKRYKKYRSETVRLRSWDYGWNGGYFVTICTHNRFCYFGKILGSKNDEIFDTVVTQNLASLRSNSNDKIGSNPDAKMHLSKIGLIAQTCWLEIPDHFPFVKLGEFIVMPNHVHGIIIIDKDHDAREKVGSQNIVSPRTSKQKPLNKFGPQSKNLPSIIRGFKIGVTKTARKIDPDFKWQPKYYDHIVRDKESYNRISEYIRNNPSKWLNDKYHL